jgi:RimJ/RimL family protein N-acetyltransferase
MFLQKQLFNGSSIYLGPIDHDNDPQVISKWSHDPEYFRLLSVKPVLPISSGQAKKKLEDLEKEINDSKNLYYFTIRDSKDDHLMGFALIRGIEWNHGNGWIQLGIGDRSQWRKGYGTEVLDMLLEYGFNELNLYRLGAEVIEYNLGAKRLLEKAGFIQEVCRRKALSREGQRWDILLYGLLRHEWQSCITR